VKDGKQYEKGFSGTFKRMGVGFKGLFGTVDDEGLKTLK
jgi:hypothetical protein